jgi:hypothetical protein
VAPAVTAPDPAVAAPATPAPPAPGTSSSTTARAARTAPATRTGTRAQSRRRQFPGPDHRATPAGTIRHVAPIVREPPIARPVHRVIKMHPRRVVHHPTAQHTRRPHRRVDRRHAPLHVPVVVSPSSRRRTHPARPPRVPRLPETAIGAVPVPAPVRVQRTPAVLTLGRPWARRQPVDPQRPQRRASTSARQTASLPRRQRAAAAPHEDPAVGARNVGPTRHC